MLIWLLLFCSILLAFSVIIMSLEIAGKYIEIRTLIKEYHKEMFWSDDSVDNTLQTIIEDSAYDVSKVLYYESISSENVGAGIDISVGSITPGNSDVIYTDGTDTLTLSVTAGGAVTIQRTAGAETFTVVLELKWI